MQLQASVNKKNLQNRLNRIEGQIRGIKGMIQEESDCQEVLRQLKAVRSSLQSTTRYFLESVVVECDAPGREQRLSRQEITSELLALISDQ